MGSNFIPVLGDGSRPTRVLADAFVRNRRDVYNLVIKHRKNNRKHLGLSSAYFATLYPIHAIFEF